MKKTLHITSLCILTCLLNSCALITVPVKVAGKVATTSVGVAGKVAGASVNAITPNSPSEE